jgi:hypothetical protein
MITTPDHFEVFGDATFVGLPGHFYDAATEPAYRIRVALLAPSAITIPPSDLPAFDLPDYEPTAADLLAIEASREDEIEARIASANTLSAFEASRRDLFRLRAELPGVALFDDLNDTDLNDTDLERVA